MTYLQAGSAIRERRLALKLSMRAAAKLGGVSATAWSDLEAGKSPPSMATQRAVAVALEWPTNWLDQVANGGSVSLPAVDLSALQAQVTALAEKVADLSARLSATGAEVARLRGRKRRDDGQ